MALSPWTAIAQGVGHGEKEVRERRREDEKRADEQAMDMWKTLLEQGFTVGDPEKGSPDGTMVRVGRIGHLIPPVVTKNAMEQKKMEFEQKMMDAQMRLAEMEEGLKKQEFGVRLDEINASAAQRAHDVDIRGMDRAAKELEFEVKKFERLSAETKSGLELKRLQTQLERDRVALAEAQAKAGVEGAPKPLSTDQDLKWRNRMREIRMEYANPKNAEQAHATATEYNDILLRIDPTARYVMRPVVDKRRIRSDKLRVEEFILPSRATDQGIIPVTITDVNKMVGLTVKWNNRLLRFDSVQGVIEYFADIREQLGDTGGPYKWLPGLATGTISSPEQDLNSTPGTMPPTSSTGPPLGRTGPPIQPGQQLNVTPGMLRRVPPPPV